MATATAPKKSALRATQRDTERLQPSRPMAVTDPGSEMRAGTLAEYTVHLRTTTNRHGRPYQEKTITAYTKAAGALDRWMTAESVADDFTACDTETLNRFFRWYYAEHDLPKSLDGKGGYTGGTNTRQRNLSPFFTWLETSSITRSPWRDKRFQKYAAPQQGKPKTLSEDFVKDVLTVTGGGSPRVRDFETVRDHALVRVLTEGLRAEELLCLRVEDLDLEREVLHVVPLKGHRGSKDDPAPAEDRRSPSAVPACPGCPQAGAGRVAVGGKALKGSTRLDAPRRHLLSAVTHHPVATPAQVEVGAKTNETRHFKPLLAPLDLAGAVVTFDALHSVKANTTWLVETKKAHYIAVIKTNQPTAYAQLAALPWTSIKIQHTASATGHGRRESRSIKTCSLADNLGGIAFPHARLALRVHRRRKPTGQTKSRESVFAITSLDTYQAGLAAAVRGRWGLENSSHHIRDVTFAEDS